MAWSPLARGFLSGKYQRGAAAPEGTRFASWQDSYRQFDNDRGWALLDVVRAVAARRGTTPAAVSLAWLLAKRECTTIVIGARTVAQLDENLRSLDVQLDASEVAELDRASEPAWGYPYDFIRMRDSA
jgi:aryl-alcohol dehydrogenase-like predicted oxidoreductase